MSAGWALRVAWLALVWAGLWGDLSLPTLVAGAALGLAVTAFFPLLPSPAAARGVAIHPVGVVRFAAAFAWDLVLSSVSVAAVALRPGARTIRGTVVEVPVAAVSELTLASVANAITLTPGTMTLDVDLERRVLRVHVFQVDGAADAVRNGHRFERLAVAAFGSAPQRALAEERWAEIERSGVLG